jgi:uncharacterized damage-inducible protein DinB
MDLQRDLIEMFQFNDHANKQALAKMREMPDPKECVRFFSHLINSQDKWMARITRYPEPVKMSWWDPLYDLEALEARWDESVRAWIEHVAARSEAELLKEVKFGGYDGATWTARLADIARQLNFHSIHHRAQIQLLIRAQGLEPEFVDYIGTRYRRIG